MLKVKTSPILARIVSKIDLEPIIKRFQALDVVKDGQTSFAALGEEQKAVVAFELLAAITPQLDKVAEELPLLIAAFKGITLEEANELDFIPVIKEIATDAGISVFFSRALRDKVAHGH